MVYEIDSVARCDSTNGLNRCHAHLVRITHAKVSSLTAELVVCLVGLTRESLRETR